MREDCATRPGDGGGPPPPIACSLTAADLSERLVEIADVGAGLIAAESAERGATLRFRNDLWTRDRLEAIVAAEAQCCAFLEMHLGTDGETIVLAIGGPPGAGPVVDDLVAAFRSGSSEGGEAALHWRRA